MYQVAKTLVALSHKGTRTSLIATLIVAVALGMGIAYVASTWLPFWQSVGAGASLPVVVAGLMGLGHVLVVRAMCRSAMRYGWENTLNALAPAIRQVQQERDAEKTRDDIRHEACLAEVRDEEPQPHLHLVPPSDGDDDGDTPTPPTLRAIK